MYESCDSMSLGERIAELRKQQKMSQGQLADALEVSRQAVSKWENGQANPDSMNLIRLSEILDTDIEYLATGRKTYGRRPPVVIKTIETVEKVVEKPVVQVVETVVEKVVEKPTIQYVEKPVVKKVFRVKYRRNSAELAIVGGICFVIGLIIGLLF